MVTTDSCESSNLCTGSRQCSSTPMMVLVSWCSGVMTDLGPTISETGPWSLDWVKVQIGQETGVGEIVCLGGYQLALADTFQLFNQTLNRAQKWFNSIFNSKLNLKYSFNQKFIQKFVQNIQFKILFKKLERSDSKCQLNINVIFEPSVRACC